MQAAWVRMVVKVATLGKQNEKAGGGVWYGMVPPRPTLLDGVVIVIVWYGMVLYGFIERFPSRQAPARQPCKAPRSSYHVSRPAFFH